MASANLAFFGKLYGLTGTVVQLKDRIAWCLNLGQGSATARPTGWRSTPAA